MQADKKPFSENVTIYSLILVIVLSPFVAPNSKGDTHIKGGSAIPHENIDTAVVGRNGR